MRKKTIVNVFHYAVKYLLIALPVILILISPFVLNDDFKGSSELEFTYKYQTNVVNSVDDLVVGNAYHYDLTDVDFAIDGSIDGSLLANSLPFSVSSSYFSDKTWNGLTSFGGSSIWSDGDNIYYSNLSNQYVLDIETSTWTPKTWNGLTSFYGQYVWSDGDYIFYSYNANQYVLDKETSTWSTKMWRNLSPSSGIYIWSDGDHIFYSYNANQYVLSGDFTSWTPKTWNGLSSFNGNVIWSDGDNFYYSSGTDHYVLDKETSTWTLKTWNGLTSFGGSNIWTYGDNIYYSSSADQYVLDKETSTWSKKSWNGLTSFNGPYIWTLGDNIYYSNSEKQYVLIAGLDFGNVIPVGNFVYNSHSSDFTYVGFITPLADADNVVDGYEYVDGGLFDDICKFFDRFAKLPINRWYVDFLNLIGVGSMVTNTALGLMFYMPLWIAYIFIFDLFLDALLMLPKTAHHWMEKIGGDYE